MSSDTVLPDPSAQLRIARQRARRWGLRGPEIDDASQNAVIAAMAFQYDPLRANGASPTTALISVMDRQIKMFIRSHCRHRNRISELDADDNADRVPQAYGPFDAVDRMIDVDAAIASLPTREREICRGLSMGLSHGDIARRLGVGRHCVARVVARLRSTFTSIN